MSDDDAADVDDIARTLGVDRSSVVRDAVRRYVNHIKAIGEGDRADGAVDPSQPAFAAVAEWGPAEDWSDWAASADSSPGT